MFEIESIEIMKSGIVSQYGFAVAGKQSRRPHSPLTI